VGTAIGKGCSYRLVGIFRQVTSPTQQLAPALDIDARLTEIERSLNLLLNVTPGHTPGHGKLAAFRRVPTGNDPPANISAGGRSVPLEIGDVERGIIQAMSKKLVADGMYFVGIDVIGDKVVEINAESTCGMQSVERLYEIDVCPTVIEALERRTDSKS
jgi:hypothetical protein